VYPARPRQKISQGKVADVSRSEFLAKVAADANERFCGSVLCNEADRKCNEGGFKQRGDPFDKKACSEKEQASFL
jgi:hypothetical protein